MNFLPFGQVAMKPFHSGPTYTKHGRMEKMNILKSALLAAILFASTPAYSFDNIRQGFILGFGAGLQTLNTEAVNLNGDIGSLPKNGLATSLKLGWGITKQLALYYVQNDSWFRAYSNGFATRETTYTIGMSGIGASYFLAPTAPSGYFLAAIGVGYLSAPFEGGNHPETGRAFMFGGGFEFERNLVAEYTVLTSYRQSSLFPSETLKSSSLQMTLNYLLY